MVGGSGSKYDNMILSTYYISTISVTTSVLIIMAKTHVKGIQEALCFLMKGEGLYQTQLSTLELDVFKKLLYYTFVQVHPDRCC